MYHMRHGVYDIKIRMYMVQNMKLHSKWPKLMIIDPRIIDDTRKDTPLNN